MVHRKGLTKIVIVQLHFIMQRKQINETNFNSNTFSQISDLKIFPEWFSGQWQLPTLELTASITVSHTINASTANVKCWSQRRYLARPKEAFSVWNDNQTHEGKKITSIYPKGRGNVESKNNSPANIRFVAKTSDIRNFSQNIRSDVKTPEVATLEEMAVKNFFYSDFWVHSFFHCSPSKLSVMRVMKRDTSIAVGTTRQKIHGNFIIADHFNP